MQQIEYIYNSPEKIITNIKLIDDFSYNTLIVLVVILIIVTLYVLPMLYIYRDYIASKKDKRKKKNYT